ncbi:TetR/AcrR family transcriptional regulator [Acinetobacter towneri]|uniref:TetR/AcrR family transcriptional regulator n=1 Tax=Acinetobacter towneri TaxID=202956 RepID=A0AB35M1W0_9GAMM|nr:TetR/AcrR family transcriptional regulator [Acinetobacter towneri]NLN57942.1 TetR/AcrR family transcriptional regulator [Gammaproteobacteria bacterium]MDM1719358.1 TetR/AcrR family transcriptional regulator [Acinetobacter towneri]MDM1730779.1 TetR/AcrR family transcriptional regulator [Acinetobacter towneri]MDM1733400.1 TetR/AcrR family transcriptional regulator [Acinetobacter towneri]MDM1736344.1 TetR/AcrR family transcriptional regulator [Acinetobacter towneri]
MTEQTPEKSSKRKQCILNAVVAALAEQDYRQLTIEDIAARAGVGKSTIYRWWKHKSDLVFEAFKQQTESVFELDFEQSLQFNLMQQLSRLSLALNHGVGRALLVVMAEQRETAGQFFKDYLLPRREQTRKLIQVAIQRGEIRADYPFEMMLDTLYGPIHYQIIFFNRMPDAQYIHDLVQLVIQPALMPTAQS